MSPRLLSETERRDWLRLARAEHVGPVTFRGLIARFGDAGAALDALPRLSARGGLGRAIRIPTDEEADAELGRIADLGARCVALGEPEYPALLQHIEDAPPLVFLKGGETVAGASAVAVVGSRNASAAGRRFARTIAGELGAAGLAVVSGLARGIDTAAHEGALDSGTVAVLAGGIDVVYPPENAELHHKIGEHGLLVSEMAPGTVPRGRHFPRRNRLISGLSQAVVVVEAARRSGSLITARLALEQGREVFAVPGSPLDPRAQGTNRLIANGAHLTACARDVLEVLEPMLMRPATPAQDAPGELGEEHGDGSEVPDGARERVLALLGPGPVDVDDVIRESGLAPGHVQLALLELELAGRVLRHGRQRVSLA